MTDKEKLDNFTEEFQKAISQMGSGYIVAMLTDKFDIQCLESERFNRDELYEKALEIRMFNEKSEIKWFRGSIDSDFLRRDITDKENLDKLSFWDETQYLDIDTTREKVYTTGGGEYSLPIERYTDAKIRVRNYLSYEEDTGQVYISDWRLVKFE